MSKTEFPQCVVYSINLKLRIPLSLLGRRKLRVPFPFWGIINVPHFSSSTDTVDYRFAYEKFLIKSILVEALTQFRLA